jgi:pimeloyl-ACP methyl ester carboxylesterase
LEKEFKYRHSIISYRILGSGNKAVICFHGYGEDAGSFSFLSKFEGDRYRFVSIDLPSHGATKWNEGLNFSSEDLGAIITAILESENISTVDFYLMGFSLGGRVALTFFQTHSQRTKKIILLAPDGLKMNFWYWASTQTMLGNRIFRWTMKHPGWFFGLLNFLHRIRLANSSIVKFVNLYIGNPAAREQLYNRWTSLRKLKPNLKKIKKEIRDNNTIVQLIYGRHDRIILPSVGERFCKGAGQTCHLEIIRSGHQVLHENHIKEILAALDA